MYILYILIIYMRLMLFLALYSFVENSKNIIAINAFKQN